MLRALISTYDIDGITAALAADANAARSDTAEPTLLVLFVTTFYKRFPSFSSSDLLLQ